eukprot:173386_1
MSLSNNHQTKPNISKSNETSNPNQQITTKILCDPWTTMVIVGKENVDKQNINRLMIALHSWLKDKYYNIDLVLMLEEFLEEEEFEDDDLGNEFGDGMREDCLFCDWLKENKGINAYQVDCIWNDLNAALQKRIVPCIAPEKHRNKYNKISYNINVTSDNLKWIEEQLSVQCPDLLIQGQRNRNRSLDIDRATYSILQIGKQNGSCPILMWLVDSFNRFRIQKRIRLKAKYPHPDIFKNKYHDIKADKFINQKCKGFSEWLIEYTNSQQKHFKDMCQASINVFCRRLLAKQVVIKNQITAVINDSIVQISFYIFQFYRFIEQFASQKNSPLPAQIDIVFIVKKYKIIDEIDETKRSDDGKDDIEDTVVIGDIGDIENRLKEQKHTLKPQPIEWRKANRIMLESINTLIENNTHNQRVVFVIDRRYQKYNGAKDTLYAYQPNKDKNCHCFEPDPSKFLCEGLIQNTRKCILPSVKNETVDIGINHHIPSCLTLSFHCLSSNEIRVYLFYNGFGARFFIQDIKYFLPA